MRVWGVDFTSRPSRRKPITLARCQLDGERLTFEALETCSDFESFEAYLIRSGPWIAGFDFPFGQSARFLSNVSWDGGDWASVISRVAAMDRSAWRAFLETYKADRQAGDREHSRGFERGTGAASPQKLYGVPVALMFYEGAPRLLNAGLTIPGLVTGDPARVAVEAYPGMLARRFTRASYKSESRRREHARTSCRAANYSAGAYLTALYRHLWLAGRAHQNPHRRPERRRARCAALRGAGGLGLAQDRG